MISIRYKIILNHWQVPLWCLSGQNWWDLCASCRWTPSWSTTLRKGVLTLLARTWRGRGWKSLSWRVSSNGQRNETSTQYNAAPACFLPQTLILSSPEVHQFASLQAVSILNLCSTENISSLTFTIVMRGYTAMSNIFSTVPIDWGTFGSTASPKVCLQLIGESVCVLFQITVTLWGCSTIQSSSPDPSSPLLLTSASCWRQQGNCRATCWRGAASHHGKTVPQECLGI